MRAQTIKIILAIIDITYKSDGSFQKIPVLNNRYVERWRYCYKAEVQIIDVCFRPALSAYWLTSAVGGRGWQSVTPNTGHYDMYYKSIPQSFYSGGNIITKNNRSESCIGTHLYVIGVWFAQLQLAKSLYFHFYICTWWLCCQLLHDCRATLKRPKHLETYYLFDDVIIF